MHFFLHMCFFFCNFAPDLESATVFPLSLTKKTENKHAYRK